MSHAVQSEKPNVSSSAALWSVLIFVGLIIAAVNFVQAESQNEGHGHAATEHHDGAAHGGHEAAEGHEAAGHGAATEAHDAADGHEGHEAPAAEPAGEEAHH